MSTNTEEEMTEERVLPRFAFTPATSYPVVKRTGVDTFVLENRLAFDFEAQGQELRAITDDLPTEVFTATLTECLGLTPDMLWAVFFGSAQLQPHAEVCEYLREKMKEFKK